MKSQTRRLVIAAIAVVLVLAAAWGLDLYGQRTGAAGEYSVRVLSEDVVIAVFTLDDLKAMEQRSAVMQGQLQEGPPLLEVLRTAGIDEFDSVIVRGMALRDAGVLELKRNEVDDDVLLDFALRGTVKLCGPDIAWGDRVRDVEEIEVR